MTVQQRKKLLLSIVIPFLSRVHVSAQRLCFVREIENFGIVYECRLDNRGSIPYRGFFSSSLCVQTSSGAHPVSCAMGTRWSFPWGKERPERDANHST
jgi:hypothetical protein